MAVVGLNVAESGTILVGFVWYPNLAEVGQCQSKFTNTWGAMQREREKVVRNVLHDNC